MMHFATTCVTFFFLHCLHENTSTHTHTRTHEQTPEQRKAVSTASLGGDDENTYRDRETHQGTRTAPRARALTTRSRVDGHLTPKESLKVGAI